MNVSLRSFLMIRDAFVIRRFVSGISFSKNYKLLLDYRASLNRAKGYDLSSNLTRSSLISVSLSLFFQSYNGTMVGDGCNATQYVPDVFLMSIILFIGTFLLSIQLKNFKNALFFPSKVSITRS